MFLRGGAKRAVASATLSSRAVSGNKLTRARHHLLWRTSSLSTMTDILKDVKSNRYLNHCGRDTRSGCARFSSSIATRSGGTANDEDKAQSSLPTSSLPSWLRSPTAPPSFNRMLLIPACVTNHLCLGSIFAWSVFNLPLTTIDGVVCPSAVDWSLGETSLTFSLVMGGFAC